MRFPGTRASRSIRLVGTLAIAIASVLVLNVPVASAQGTTPVTTPATMTPVPPTATTGAATATTGPTNTPAAATATPTSTAAPTSTPAPAPAVPHDGRYF